MTSPFVLGFTGSRTYTKQAPIWDACDRVLEKHGALIARHGACPTGGDSIFNAWAEQRLADGFVIEIQRFPAPWKLLGGIAGQMRNGYMAGLWVDGWVAAIENESRGATGCATFAESVGQPVWRLP